MLKQCFLAGSFLAASAFAGLAVSWEVPEKGYIDVLDRTLRVDEGLKRVQGILGTWLERQGRRVLREGVNLEVTITEVDLAGRPVPFTRSGPLGGRTYSDADRPEIHLRWRLDPGNGEAVKSGDAVLTKALYLNAMDARSEDSLPFEKELLRSWLSRFAKEHSVRK